MNLLDFLSKIVSSDSDRVETDSFFSEEITIFNILNGSFRTEDIISIRVDKVNKIVSVDISSEDIARNAEFNLDKQIVPGSYVPLYRVNVTRNNKTLYFKLDEV